MRDRDSNTIPQMSSPFLAWRPEQPGPCIDGVAEVTSRRTPAANQSAGKPSGFAEPTTSFGRRQNAAHSIPTPRMASQTVESGDAEIAAAVLVDAKASRASSPATAQLPARRSKARLSLVVGAFAFGALLLPVFLVSFPETPVAAVATNGSGFAVRLGPVSASLSDHGDGRMLKVAGTITNPGQLGATVPPLRIDFADSAKGLRSRMLQTTVARLDAGQSIDFVSMIAMPADTKGDVQVGFFGMKGASDQ